jgi:hypothetical protein
MMQGAGQALGPFIGGSLLAIGRYDLAFVAAGVMAAATPLLATSWPVPASRGEGRPGLAAFGQGVRDVCGRSLILVTARRARYGAAHGVFGTIYDVGDACGRAAAGFLVAWVAAARSGQWPRSPWPARRSSDAVSRDRPR